jgi:hypothetical protein
MQRPCQNCPINTFAAVSGQSLCTACSIAKSTAGLLGQTYCECAAGTQRESSDVLSACQACIEGKFKAAPRCIFCDIGKSRSANTNNSILCKDCTSGSFHASRKVTVQAGLSPHRIPRPARASQLREHLPDCAHRKMQTDALAAMYFQPQGKNQCSCRCYSTLE